MTSEPVSVVVPVYNGRSTLGELVSRIRSVFAERTFELILVDDGSTDGSDAEIRALASQFAEIRALTLMRNFGQHNALLAGVRAARFPTTVTLDDDLQNPPEEIPLLLAKLSEGLDVVYGVPLRVRQDRWRILGSRLIRFALRGSIGKRRAAMVSPFRAFRTELRRAFEDYGAASLSLDVLLAWGSARVDSVAVNHAPRESGPSRYTLRRLVSHALAMMTGFSTWPLRFASVTGFFFTLFGMAVFAYVLIRYLMVGRSVPGFPFLASIIAIFSGAQLFALGIMGEYLARMHTRMMNKPPYVVKYDSHGSVDG